MGTPAKLQALVRKLGEAGTPPEVRDDRLTEAMRELLIDDALAQAVLTDVDRFVDRYLAQATADIFASGGDMAEIGDQLATAYLAGLTKGLALAVVSGHP